ncbi:MAG: efflux RND transporter periplasmic adaptor subunit [Achromobacter sp.]|uniref:Multidrug efflux pump subunit AcrA n=2 Tax=Pseudomonadota TaxID=1224 RepID=A0A6J5AQG1_9BURK|nr:MULTISPECIES: efflux RND transporter periplasmic adaptor subunit [Achromobacter]MBN9638935.1 efflux RND transporter periplasmic adaptor subunit [Achromobacter sp.]MCG2597448.1 efflux RND transporter periplasmic adaptor subunit [Achromobacter sp.]MCG2603311.1 efflux RND transporter periplasmic adaptor subunit [Achromobacter sp.]CAB3655665.1 Multidrug efflux pump subunit AcrA [Achromobacter insuavis]CUJ14237.1 Acriflavine resistance protein A precursor [Achromobacter sp. 2789STDY5608633]
MSKHQPWRWPVAVAAAAVLLAGCGGEAGPTAAAEPRAVQAVAVQPQRYTLASSLPGRVEPVRVAEVRARVAGIVLSREFEEGADVKAGDVLFRIDPAPFKAALSRAEGDLAKSEAALSEAQAVVRRYTPLVKIEAVSQQDFDTATAALKSAQAARRSAQADVETARLNLDYATVKAPISGRIGRAQVTEGALVGQNEATVMAKVQQLDPIYVDFTQPVADMLRTRTAMQTGELGQEEGAAISISIDGTDRSRNGRLLFSDIAVDRGTGQVSLRGEFANPDVLLLPGMYVRVQTRQGVDPDAILVPQRAVVRSTDGKPQVLVAGPDDVVETRAVRTGTMRGADWHIVEGLAAGDRVIVGGVSAAVPGQKVSVTLVPQADKVAAAPVADAVARH